MDGDGRAVLESAGTASYPTVSEATREEIKCAINDGNTICLAETGPHVYS